jgi:carbamoyltransferase
MRILGLSCFYHYSAAAIVEDGEIIAAAQEERFTRQKHTPDFPFNAIKYCLEESGFSLNEIYIHLVNSINKNCNYN